VVFFRSTVLLFINPYFENGSLESFFGNIDSGSVLNSLSKNGKVMLICTRASPGCLILTNFFAVLHVYWYCSC